MISTVLVPFNPSPFLGRGFWVFGPLRFGGLGPEREEYAISVLHLAVAVAFHKNVYPGQG